MHPAAPFCTLLHTPVLCLLWLAGSKHQAPSPLYTPSSTSTLHTPSRSTASDAFKATRATKATKATKLHAPRSDPRLSRVDCSSSVTI
ncbi:hypothetical protein G7Z17_g10736 [Cylindrodendrum hubeiense]|uniref:Secreted protein n=1 Tax=Cylindrodendrum hubeiense TaxID=595255 RepID=A0A9P5H0Y3_9HYPO|nr:hypothetical protein G7Z17_g10736 [Cylindrodendrum hubeiense]